MSDAMPFEITEISLFDDISDQDILPQYGSMTSDDVLAECLNRCGHVDMKLMQSLSGLSVGRLITDLRGKAILQDPKIFLVKGKKYNTYEGWKLLPQYLCGNILKKLKEASEAEEKFSGCFQANVDALMKLLPPRVGLENIHASLGVPWIPPQLYSRFVVRLLALNEYPRVLYNKELSQWKIVPPKNCDKVLNNVIFGTFEMSAVKIIEQTMNAKTPKVYYPSTGTDSERVLNRAATLAVQERQKKIIAAFDEFVKTDDIMKINVEEKFNELFASGVNAKYDGSFLRLPGLNPAVKLYRHQKDTVARIILSESNILLSHDVGTGKTYIMAVAAHELHRLKLSKKILITVPNNVLKAAVDAHKLLYPDDRIFAVYPEEFRPNDRSTMLERIRDEDFVAIYMAYSSFDMIKMSKEYYFNKGLSEIRKLRAAAANARNKYDRHALNGAADELSKKLTKYMNEAADTPWPTFDSLGITTLFVDEAHNYKNIPLKTKTDGIVGIHAKGSAKCAEMLEKARFVDRVIFATGTPLTNSLADLWVMQTYLQENELRFRDISSFDVWVNTFAERETNYEVEISGSKLREMTRFSSFHNLPELMSMFSGVCDFYHGEDIGDDLPEPEYEEICVPKSEKQAEYIKALAERTELIHSHQSKRTEDNLLKVTVDGRKAALDVRLVGVQSDHSGKISACANRISEIYSRNPGTAQIVFSDIGTSKPGFNVYDALKDELIKRGIPAGEIAYIHDAVSDREKSALFSAINKGGVRVVIGSTQKLGTGVNVQEKLIALHHLDVPWRPADMVQREGRIIRPGNTCSKVHICRYITEGSFDAYSWQLLENKQRFISNFLSGESTCQSSDDISDAVLSYAEIKALAIGNPLVKKRVETANILQRTKTESKRRQEELMTLRNIVERTPEKLEKRRAICERIRADIACYFKNRESIPNVERIAFGEEFLEALKDNALKEQERLFDRYQGFDVVLPANMLEEKKFIILRQNCGNSYAVEFDGDATPYSVTRKLDYLLDGLQKRLEGVEKQIETDISDCDRAEEQLLLGNEYETKIEELTAELERIDKELAEQEEKEAS